MDIVTSTANSDAGVQLYVILRVDQSDWQSFAIYENASWRHIGATLLIDIHHTDGPEFGIMIGEPDARGKGYGTEATALMLDHAFLALGLSNVMLRVYSYNLAGIHVYEKVGFRVMGIRRKSKLMGGKLWDTIYMEALADEFESPVLGKILVPGSTQACRSTSPSARLERLVHTLKRLSILSSTRRRVKHM
ncbi:MAG: GNAT family protein [Thermomicrobiales bacterium]